MCGVPGDQSTCAQISVPLGGPQLFILNSELRFPTHILDKLGAVVFYDGGNVFRNLGLGDIRELQQYSRLWIQVCHAGWTGESGHWAQPESLDRRKCNAIFYNSGAGILKAGHSELVHL